MAKLETLQTLKTLQTQKMFLTKNPKSPYWQMVWYNADTGKPKSLSTKTKNKKEAEKIAAGKEREIKDRATERAKNLLYNEPLKLTDAFTKYTNDRENTEGAYKKGTIETYEKAFKYFYPACGNKNIEEYTRNDYHTFVESMNKLNQNSKAAYTKCIYAIFKWLVKERYLNYNPMKTVSPPRATEIIAPTKEEINALLNYSKKSVYKNFIRFTLLSAFRKHETLKLRPIDIRLNRIYIEGKGGKFASIPIIKQMEEFLPELPKIKKDERYFTFAHRSIDSFFSRFKKQTGIHLTCHDLRTFIISELANNNGNPFFVQRYARHSDIKTTLKYYIGLDMDKMIEQFSNSPGILSDLEL